MEKSKGTKVISKEGAWVAIYKKFLKRNAARQRMRKVQNSMKSLKKRYTLYFKTAHKIF